MEWFLVGCAIGALATFWWCHEHWYKHKANAERFNDVIRAASGHYNGARRLLEKWGHLGLTPSLPADGPPYITFRYNWALIPDKGMSTFISLMEQISVASELSRLLDSPDSAKVTLRRRIEHARATVLQKITTDIQWIECAHGVVPASLPPPTHPIDLSQFADVESEDDEREESETQASQERMMVEVREQMDRDEEELNVYLRKLILGQCEFFSSSEVEAQIAITKSQLDEIRLARKEDRIPNLVDYEDFLFDDLEEYDEAEDDEP